MHPDFVVISGVDRKDPAQIAFAEDDDVIEAFPADRADQSPHLKNYDVASYESTSFLLVRPK
jgi:hypothetical protein